MAAARTFSVAKRLIANSSHSMITRRGVTYAAVSHELEHVSSRPRSNMINDRSNRVAESANAWGPDPVTGFYRPMHGVGEMDVADLRNMLLKNRIRAN